MRYTMRTEGDLQDKLLNKMHVDENGCWIWEGSRCRNYGTLYHKGLTIGAHRLSYEAFNGPIAKGLLVCHSCDVPSCINPDHLWLGTQKENMQDCSKKGRGNHSAETKRKIRIARTGKPRGTYKKTIDLGYQ